MTTSTSSSSRTYPIPAGGSRRHLATPVPLRGVPGDQVDDPADNPGRDVVAHAGDGDVAGAVDRRGGRRSAAGRHDQVAVAVDHQRRGGHVAQFGGAVTGLEYRVELARDTLAGRFPKPTIPGPGRVLGRAGLVDRVTGARQVAHQLDVLADELGTVACCRVGHAQLASRRRAGRPAWPRSSRRSTSTTPSGPGSGRRSSARSCRPSTFRPHVRARHRDDRAPRSRRRPYRPGRTRHGGGGATPGAASPVAASSPELVLPTSRLSNRIT